MGSVTNQHKREASSALVNVHGIQTGEGAAAIE
jgi:hypothetical protein